MTTIPPSWNRCPICLNPASSRKSKYCAEHRAEGRKNQRAAATAWNKAQWELRKLTGIDPTHGGDAARKRGATIAESNREKPRKSGAPQELP